jgi:hypothetical protein
MDGASFPVGRRTGYQGSRRYPGMGGISAATRQRAAELGDPGGPRHERDQNAPDITIYLKLSSAAMATQHRRARNPHGGGFSLSSIRCAVCSGVIRGEPFWTGEPAEACGHGACAVDDGGDVV